MDIPVLLLLILEAGMAYVLLDRTAPLKTAALRICAAAVIIASFSLRYFALPHETADYLDFLTRWVSWFRDNGGFSALKGSIGNYNIPYLYFLAFFSYLPIRDLYLIKLLSIFFDVLLAWSVCRITALFRPSPAVRLAAFSAVLFLPTVFLNGAFWGQCDSIYVALALLAMDSALRRRPVRSMILLAASFSFKLQAVFLIPVFALFLLRGDLKFRHLAVFPLSYGVIVLPAVLAGRPVSEVFTLYFDHLDSVGTGLNYNSPSVFSFLDFRTPPADPQLLSRAGILAAFAFMFTILLICLVKRRRLNRRAVILTGALLALGIPYLLPRMHERYFFGADVLTLVTAFLFPEAIPIALLTQFASFLGYYAYLEGRYLLLMRAGGVCMAVSLLLLLMMFFRELSLSDPEKIPERENKP